jgi:hypothetical protein
MSRPAVDDIQASEKKTEEVYDFAETSDICDFGYVLVAQIECPTTREPLRKHPA